MAPQDNSKAVSPVAQIAAEASEAGKLAVSATAQAGLEAAKAQMDKAEAELSALRAALPSALIVEVRDLQGHVYAVGTVNRRGESDPMSTGSLGFFGTGPGNLGGIPHQMQFTFTEIGSQNPERAALAARNKAQKAAVKAQKAARK